MQHLHWSKLFPSHQIMLLARHEAVHGWRDVINALRCWPLIDILILWLILFPIVQKHSPRNKLIKYKNKHIIIKAVMVK